MIFFFSLQNNLSQHSFSSDENGFDRFCHICVETINKHSPRKKTVRGNHSLFSRVIIKCTQLRNKYLKLSTNERKLISTRQRNYCVSLIRKSKSKIYGNIKNITDNRKFWKTVKVIIQIN